MHCAAMSHFAKYDEDITENPHASCLSKKTFILKQDVFIYYGDGTSKLSEPWFPLTPSSIELYDQYGEDWIYHDPKVKGYGGMNKFYPYAVIQGIVRKGTRIYISKVIVKHFYDDSPLIRMEGCILDGEFKGKTYDMSYGFLHHLKPSADLLQLCE